MSGRTGRASDDEFPELPPLSEPPSARGALNQLPRNDEPALPYIEEPLTGRMNALPARAPIVAAPPVAPRGIPSPELSRHTMPGDVVLHNKFRLLRQLEARDEELVYQGLHTGTGRQVQVHMLASGLPADGPAAQRLVRAARAAGRVPHPNILSVVDSATDDEGRPFLVYEHFAGKPLSELVERHGPFDPRLGAEVMLHLLEALHALHSRGVLHRHIRPENVLLERSGSTLRIKLTGFVHAVVTGKGGPIPDLPKGYSRYLAPEARRGIDTAAPSMDIYAAGVLMRFLLTGDTDPSVELEAKAARAIARATEDDPEERFQSAESFLAAVSLMIPSDDGHPDSIVPPDPLAADLKYMQQRRERDSGVTLTPTGTGKIELFAALMMIEAIYARLGAEGWRQVIAEMPEIEQLLPAAGKGDHFREHGVDVSLIQKLLALADAIGGQRDLGWLPQIGEAMTKRGLSRLCPQLPKVLTPDVLVACVPVLWSSLSRQGEVVVLEQLGTSARIAIRAQVEPCLELCAVVAGMLRAQLRELVPDGEVSCIASQALGDAADVFVLTWG